MSVFRQKGNISLVLRLIPSRILTFEEIGLPPIVKALCRRPRGLFLVTGPTGSGKTTTLATMLDYINRNFDRHIISVEDPIEYYHKHHKSCFSQREVGIDVPSFAEALRRSLRMDPDVILVGEMRDLETMEAAIRAAETGHLVFATLHTTGAQGTINRIIDAFPVAQQEQIRVQLSTNLLAILSQALLPTKDGKGRIRRRTSSWSSRRRFRTSFARTRPTVSTRPSRPVRSSACSFSMITCGSCTTLTWLGEECIESARQPARSFRRRSTSQAARSGRSGRADAQELRAGTGREEQGRRGRTFQTRCKRAAVAA